jgi:hypothetical protein
MMTLELSHRDRRIASIGVIIVGGLLVVSRGVPTLRARERLMRSNAESMAEQLASAARVEEMLPAICESLSVRQQRLAALESRTIVARSPGDAGAALAAALEALADSARFRVTGLQLRVDTLTVSGMTHVGVRLTGLADVVGLGALMRSIEDDNGSPMIVRDLAVSQPEPASPSAKIETLRIDMFVEALCDIEPGKPR